MSEPEEFVFEGPGVYVDLGGQTVDAHENTDRPNLSPIYVRYHKTGQEVWFEVRDFALNYTKQS